MKNRSFGYVASGLSALLAFGSVWASEEGVQVYELEALKVVSTGTRTERLSKEAPVRTEVLSSQLFDDAATRDLGAAIEYLPGIRSEANCQNCGTAEIKMLGLGAGYSQLLFDSQPLFSGLASVYGIEHIPTAFIERLEVVKGGASSLYGPGAVAGVVNILPREPVANKFRQDVSVEDIDGATFFSSSLVRDWTSEGGDQAVSLYVQYNDSEAVDLNDDGFSDITQKEFYTLGTNAWFYPTENGRLSLNYSYSWEERRGGDRFDLRPHETQITERLEHNWHRGGFTWEGNSENGLFYRLSGSMSYVDRHSYYGGVGDVALPGMDGFEASTYEAAVEDSRLLYGFSDTTRYYLEALFSQSVGEHYLSWGAQYQYDEVFDEKRDELGQSLISDGSLAGFVGEDPIARGDFSDLGFFFQDEWMPAEKMTVVTGLRIDKHSELSAWTASPRAAVRIDASKEWTWRASLATGFRAPEIFDEDFHIEILDDPTRTRNAADLKEEKSTSYAGGFVWIPAFADNRLQVDAELFRTELEDAFHVPDVVMVDGDGLAYKERVNAGSSVVQGMELNFGYGFNESLSGEIGATYVDGRFGEAQEVLPGVFERRFIETPELTGVAQLKYENERFVDVFLGMVYTGPMIAVKEVDEEVNRSTDEFFVVDFTVTKHLELAFGGRDVHLDLLLGVKNLFDERQKDLTAGPNRDTTYFYGPRFPRSFVARANVKW